jgi:hypothetical protein
MLEKERIALSIKEYEKLQAPKFGDLKRLYVKKHKIIPPGSLDRLNELEIQMIVNDLAKGKYEHQKLIELFDNGDEKINRCLLNTLKKYADNNTANNINRNVYYVLGWMYEDGHGTKPAVQNMRKYYDLAANL